MSPIGMTILLVCLIGFFIWTARRRWRLMMIGQPEHRFDQVGRRIILTIKYAFGQVRMPRYPWSGLAHIIVFFGFLVLLLRSLILWGRGAAGHHLRRSERYVRTVGYRGSGDILLLSSDQEAAPPDAQF